MRAHSNGNGVARRRPRVVVLYHYFHPDDVVSARHYAEFCADLADRGWEVEVLPCNRSCRDEAQSFLLREDWEAVAIRRVWRPAFRQASTLGRLLNAAWMLSAWTIRLVSKRRHIPDVLVIGTDPVLSVLVAPVVRKLLPGVRIVHWCYDLYPEGPIAEGMLREQGLLARTLRRMLQKAYAACDVVADLGSCMRQRLEAYRHASRKVTMVPWALAETPKVPAPDPHVRRELFGTSRLGLLYSGNFGRAHAHAELLGLARNLRGDGVHFCFGVRGNRASELRSAIGPDDRNVSLAGFAPESALLTRLTAADIHLVSLRPEWSGLVVPSKFFGALAVGRPVLFAGPRDAAIGRWIEDYQVGWVLDRQSDNAITATMRELAVSPDKLVSLQHHCHRVYQERFARQRVMDEWDRLLRDTLTRQRTPSPKGAFVDLQSF
jgi:glycosyltransferase involved in cell wall biosynthesis